MPSCIVSLPKKRSLDFILITGNGIHVKNCCGLGYLDRNLACIEWQTNKGLWYRSIKSAETIRTFKVYSVRSRFSSTWEGHNEIDHLMWRSPKISLGLSQSIFSLCTIVPIHNNTWCLITKLRVLRIHWSRLFMAGACTFKWLR